MKNALNISRRLSAGYSTLAIFLGLALLPPAHGGEPARLLVLTHTGLYRHASLEAAEAAVAAIGERSGVDVTTLQGYRQETDAINLSMISEEFLSSYDAVFMMTNGNLPMDNGQREALVNFVKNGGGLIGAHCATLTFYDFPPFGEMLGAYYRRSIKQNKVFVLKVEDPAHPATRMLGPSWPLVDEFYEFGRAPWSAERPEENVDVLFGNRIPMGFSRERVHVLLSIDTKATDISDLPEFDPAADYPQAWCRDFGKGRVFYTALGHRPGLWSDPVFQAHLEGGIRWTLGNEPEAATPR